MHTCVSCSVVVSSRANGAHHTGKVSNNVGRECVNNGFMYRESKLPHHLAKIAFSLGFLIGSLLLLLLLAPSSLVPGSPPAASQS